MARVDVVTFRGWPVAIAEQSTVIAYETARQQQHDATRGAWSTSAINELTESYYGRV